MAACAILGHKFIKCEGKIFYQIEYMDFIQFISMLAKNTVQFRKIVFYHQVGSYDRQLSLVVKKIYCHIDGEDNCSTEKLNRNHYVGNKNATRMSNRFSSKNIVNKLQIELCVLTQK